MKDAWKKILEKVSLFGSIFISGAVASYFIYLLYDKYKEVQNLSAVIYRVWNYTLYAEGQLTVGKLAMALTLIVLGFWASKYISSKLVGRIVRRTKVNKGAQAAIENLSYYVFVVIFALIALNVAKVPLTVFTIFGGALAIGVGFGSQTILQNFISGIIIQIEQPIKVGDIVEMEAGVEGIVEHIGGRSTKIIAPDNTHIIVPNSELLNKRLINWTLTDNVIRSYVDVGFHYKSDPKIIRDILEKTLDEFTNIKKHPAPRILFTNFGADALEFRVYYWSTFNTSLDRKELESNIRFKLIKKVRDAGLEIPYPQRTISWDSPLEISKGPETTESVSKEGDKEDKS